MKDIQSLSQFQASRIKPLNEGADVKASQKKITDILAAAGYVDGEEFWFAGAKTIQCDSAQNAKLVCKTLQADDIKCHVDKSDVDVVLEGAGTPQLESFLKEKLAGEAPAADGDRVVLQESDLQPADIQATVDQFNEANGTRYTVKPGKGDGDPKFVVDQLDETVIMKASAPKFDVTTSAKSIAARVTDLIGRMNTMSMESIRDEFKRILTSDDTHASDPTRRKWLDIANNARSKFSLMKSITDLYLAAANMKVDPNSY